MGYVGCPPVGPLSGLGSRGYPLGRICASIFLGWADPFARIGSLITAVDLSGGIDWVFPFVPMEACRACQSPLMKRVCDMWLALSSFFHPCTLEVRSERPMASSLPPPTNLPISPPF